jgi:hypothetical protein
MSGDTLKVVAVTCAKNEGPFILEWIAYHKLIGFTDVIVFTNECTDGTDDLLDRLDEMNVVQHMPNPRVINETLRFQAAALRYASEMRLVRQADWRLSFDSDEFVSIKPGEGHVSDLVAHSPKAHLISICQLQFGCSHIDTFIPGLSTEQFTWHQSHKAKEGTSRRRDLERGLKTFIRADAPVVRWNNHFPDLDPEKVDEALWVYGDNHKVPDAVYNGKTKSLPAENCYGLAQLNHYATRSRESFLVQSHRGNAVKLNEQADVKYWQRYNHNAEQGGAITRHVPALHELLMSWLDDPELRRRQDVCNARHSALIETLKKDTDYANLHKRVTRIDERARKQKEAQ